MIFIEVHELIIRFVTIKLYLEGEVMKILKNILLPIFLLLLVEGELSAQGAMRALAFDGTDDYVNIPYSSTFDMYEDFTVEFWWCPNQTWDESTTLDNNAIISRSSGGSNYSQLSDWSFFLFSGKPTAPDDDDGRMRFGTYGGNVQTTRDSWVAGTWYHIAISFTSSSDVTFYVNGVEDNYGDDFDAGAVNGTANNPLMVGRGFYDAIYGPGYFPGKVDELRIWEVARSQDDIINTMCERLIGNESNLVAYYRFDASSGSNLEDLTSNNNDGTLENMDDSDWVYSGAAIGDESVADYTDGGSFIASISYNDLDDFTATTTSGTIDGIHVYRVDAPSVRSGSSFPSNYVLDPLRFWGVFIVGSNNPQYSVVYNYDGHPGIVIEADLELTSRNSYEDDSWEDANATLDTDAKTLSLSNQSGTEYALASSTSDNPLPVQLSHFSAIPGDREVMLEWVTESEKNNQAFILERSMDNHNFLKVIEIQGQGNSTITIEYTYRDQNLLNEMKYYYRLSNREFDGKINHCATIFAVPSASNVLDYYNLFQNYPNPFNSETTIRFNLPEKSKVFLAIYNSAGQIVDVILNEELSQGVHETVWNAGKIPSGIYFYKLETNEYTSIKKMMLLK